MLMKDITPGRQVWFQESGVGENGKTERRMCQGTVTGMDGKKVSIQMKGENDTRALHPFQCFATQDELKSEMKWDLYMDTFQDKLCSAAEKYMGKCTSFFERLHKVNGSAGTGTSRNRGRKQIETGRQPF